MESIFSNGAGISEWTFSVALPSYPTHSRVVGKWLQGKNSIVSFHDVDVDDIEFLRSLRFSFTRIAQILGASRSTIYRRMEVEGVSFDRYSDISDHTLDQLKTDIKQRHPDNGERLIIGHLGSDNIILPRTRIRASIHGVDPEGTAIRRSLAVRRRVYHAKGLNYVWHIDGNHKLSKYRFVVHGAIDGYSRMIMYLTCSDNNRANTVLLSFSRAVQVSGLPAHVRSDLGGENFAVWRFMAEQHSSQSTVITGSSTHNERIERLERCLSVCRCTVSQCVFIIGRRGQVGHLK